MRFRTGIGIDAHRFTPGRPLILGGVEIEHDQGLAGHSDADVLSHAIADALLGAAGLEDIGHYFPDTDPEWENISSLVILERVAELLHNRGCRIGNVDAVLMLEQPRISHYRDQIRAALSGALSLATSAVSVRGTTTEKMGFTGRGEGIAAFATALVECENVMDIDL